MWEIDVVSIMKTDFIEKDKDCSKYGWSTQDGHLFQGIHWVFVGIIKSLPSETLYSVMVR